MDVDIKWSEIIELYRKYDVKDFLSEYLRWGERFIRSVDRTSFITDEFEKIIIVGMGGSGIVGDILQDLYIWDKDIAVDVVKNSRLPKHVEGKRDLVIGISFSGNTLETISSVKEAIDKGIRVIGITTDGELSSLLMKKNIPVILIEKALAPRAGLPQLLGSTLKAITSDEKKLDRYKEIGGILKKKAGEYGIDNEMNKAFTLAYYMWGRLPIFYGDLRYHSILHRAKSSINENAKVSAYYSMFPEGFHNEVEVYEEYIDPNMLPIILKDEYDGMKPLIKHLDEMNIEYLTLSLEGRDVLEKILSTILLVDVASVYLSYLRRRNPFEIYVINKIKMLRGRV